MDSQQTNYFLCSNNKKLFSIHLLSAVILAFVLRHFQSDPVITTPVTQTPDVTWILQYSNKKYSQYRLLSNLQSIFHAAHALLMSPQTLFVFNETIYQASLTHE